MCIGVSSKIPPPLSCQASPLNLQTIQAPFLSNPPSILAFHEPFLKVGFFSEPQKSRGFSPLTQSYLQKVTKFLVEISQIEFLILTEKNISAHKRFRHSIFQILIYFYVKTAPLPPLLP